ncbi:hypothetical protein ACRCPS_17445 [Pseudomonas aeruginosa]
MSTTAFMPIAAHPGFAVVLILCLAGISFKLLGALGDYLGWLSIKDHEITDPELRKELEGVQPPPYLLRLLTWLAIWFVCASAFKAIAL